MQRTEIIAGMTPTRTSLKANSADSAATVRSHAAASPTPPPKAWPLIRPMTGFGNSQTVFSTSTKGLSAAPMPPAFRSAPAQNAGPAPVRTTARTSAAALAAARCARSSPTSASESAFRRSGWSSVIHAASPRSS